MAADDWTKTTIDAIPATGKRKTTIESDEDGIAWITYEVRGTDSNKAHTHRCTVAKFITDNPSAAAAIATTQTTAKAYFDGLLGFVAPPP